MTTTRIIRAIVRTALYLVLVGIVLAAMIACLCSFDPEQPGFVCDYPGLFVSSAAIGFAAIASIVGLSIGNKPKDVPNAQTRSEYTNTHTTIAKTA